MMALGLLLALAVPPAPAPLLPPVVALPARRGPVLEAGTLVNLRTEEPLSSRTARQGQRFAVRVTEEVRVDGLLVIPRGTPGFGEVTRVREKGVFGKSGKLRIRPIFVELNGSRILLEGEARGKGQAGTAPVVLAAPLIGISSGFFSGTSAVIPAGTPLTGYVSKDVPLATALAAGE